MTIGDAPAYSAAPGEQASNQIGVIVIHDIYGFNIPNSKYVVDHFASSGFHAVLPNLYHENGSLDGWPCSEFDDGDPLEGGKWDGWWKEITTEPYWTRFHAQMASCVDFLKQKGCAKMCVIGFCWGGIAIEQLSTLGVFSEAASVHGCHESPDNYNAAKAAGCNIAYHTVPDDESFQAPAQNLLRNAGASVTVYDAMYHGFAVRGDFENNPALKSAADSCFKAIVQQFSRVGAAL